MYIVLEGLDKQGKTSLAKHFSEVFGWKIKKFSKPEGDPYVEYMNFLLNNKEPMILDRFYLGELVYGPVKRGKSGLSDWQVRNIEKLLQMRNSINIYCYTDEVTTRANFIKDKEEYAQLEDIAPLTEYFNLAQDKSILPWWRFSYLLDPEYRGVDKLLERWWMKTGKHLQKIISMVEPRTTGSFFAKTLILGEISNVELEQAKYRDVNVGFANGPSAELLYSILPKEGIALSNVKKAHENNEVKYLDRELLLPYVEKVICLGNVAKNLLEQYKEENNIPRRLTVYKTFHPSFVLRGGTTKEKYAKELRHLLM
jgi:hypothetical protein